MAAPQSAPELHLGAEADPLVGRVLNGRYTIVSALGHGGMGRVYKALQAPLDRVVALKVLGAGHDRDPNFYKRFFLEASVTARLTHPNTITLYDYGRTEDGVLFIAMEYLNGRTLSQAMQADGPLAQERVIHIAQQICRSLREAHSIGIIHRDLKPANVMLLTQHDDHDFVKVLDFGLVKFFSGEGTEGDITNAGTFMGSPHYIAPEQARNQSPDQRCDIYSLGVLLYHMLTGRAPFTGAAPVDIILKHLHEAPVPLAEARPDLRIAPELQQVVLRCMAKGRDERFQSMDELLLQLKAVRAKLSGAATPQPSNPDLTADVSAGAVAQTPPTPQPGLRTPSQPMSAMRATPARGIPHVSRPPPPPVEALFDQATPVRRSAGRPGVPWRRRAAKAGPILRVAGPPAFILLAGIGAAIYVLRAPVQVAVVRVAAAPAVTSPPLVTSSPAVIPPPAVISSAEVASSPAMPMAAAAPQGGLVTVSSLPSGAEVRDANDRRLGTTPLDLRARPGALLRLTLRLKGYRPATVNRKVDGEYDTVRVTMKRAQPIASPPKPRNRSAGYKEDPY
jgi:serine/threonine-protein kinase